MHSEPEIACGVLFLVDMSMGVSVSVTPWLLPGGMIFKIIFYCSKYPSTLTGNLV